MIVRRLVTALLLGAALTAVTAAPAFAHAELIASTPAAGETLAAPPQQVQLTFNQPVLLGPDPVTVTGPGGASWTVGQASVAGAVVTVAVQPSGPAGPHTLTYRVVSEDGDEVSGTVAFTLATAAATPTTTATTPPTTESPAPPTTESVVSAAADTTDDRGVPVWVWILGAAVVLAVGVVVALRLARRS